MDHRTIVNYILMGSNVLAVLGLVWHSWHSQKRADRWEKAARNIAQERRRENAPTVVCPEWHAPKSDTLWKPRDED